MEQAGDPRADEPCARITLVLRGTTYVVDHRPGETVVQAAFRQDVRPPISCLEGQCGTCLARVTGGRVRMIANDVLTSAEVAQGYALTCQAVPVTREVAVVYED